MESLTWTFQCNECKRKFEHIVPRGPAEERAIKCPHCSSNNIKNCTLCTADTPPCGG